MPLNVCQENYDTGVKQNQRQSKRFDRGRMNKAIPDQGNS